MSKKLSLGKKIKVRLLMLLRISIIIIRKTDSEFQWESRLGKYVGENYFSPAHVLIISWLSVLPLTDGDNSAWPFF